MNGARSTARRLLGQVRALREEVALAGGALASRWRPAVADTAFTKRAQNLAHYLAFRRHDLRMLQQALIPLGVSSLGRCEAHVLPTLDAVLATLAMIAETDPATLPPRPCRQRFVESERILARQAVALIGPVSASRSVRIMVTLPTEAAAKRSWARQLIEAGIDCVRINCAHDEPSTWMKMVRNVRAAANARGRSCKILMDLTGPRVRTKDVVTPKDHSRVRLQDRILLTRAKLADDSGADFQAQCSLPDVFAELKSKRLVYFNEGRIGAQVVRVTPAGAELRVVAARPRGEKFRSGMALNFPGTDLHIPL